MASQSSHEIKIPLARVGRGGAWHAATALILPKFPSKIAIRISNPSRYIKHVDRSQEILQLVRVQRRRCPPSECFSEFPQLSGNGGTKQYKRLCESQKVKFTFICTQFALLL
ncbi:hypothetical protein EVAR_72474_1 [Eumeta japonica]|uniref:Uncharacterized protein n=1 Tax=Eumeta variegata TaxID=151549 RepID=A0A4C1SVX8_EUMVA|nr:hypothetical protein EVAR_72474_1 [Eumeta japonica]